MRGELVELSCPFCDKGKINCLYVPSATKVRRVSGSFGRGQHYSKSAEVWLIQSGCSVCGKSAEEVEKELKKKNII